MLKYSKLVLLLSLLTVSFSAQAHPRNGDCSGGKGWLTSSFVHSENEKDGICGVPWWNC
jgi:hypothetical protein